MAVLPTDGMLTLLRERGRLMLAGNGQFFEGLDYLPELGFLHFYGDSGLNQETSRLIVAEPEVLELLRAYFRRKAQLFSELELPTDAEVLAYMTTHINI